MDNANSTAERASSVRVKGARTDDARDKQLATASLGPRSQRSLHASAAHHHTRRVDVDSPAAELVILGINCESTFNHINGCACPGRLPCEKSHDSPAAELVILGINCESTFNHINGCAWPGRLLCEKSL